MEQRSLGRTGLFVSRLGLGCGSVGGLMVRGDAAEQRRTIARALDAGITYFDTAASYGDGRSEENLGRALASLEAGDRALVGTKVALSTSDLEQPAAAIRSSLEASLRRLGRDEVDLFQFHNAVHEPSAARAGGGVERPLVLGEIAEAMGRAVQDGLARHVGFTGLGETESLHHLIDEGQFETVQAYLNAINPSGVWPGVSGGEQDFQGLVTRAAEHGLGVINIRVFAAGALAGDVVRHPVAGQIGGPSLITGAGYADDVARSNGLARLAGELGLESSLELALRFAIAAPGVSTVLVGLSSFEQLEAALAWNDRGPLDSAVVERVLDLARS